MNLSGEFVKGAVVTLGVLTALLLVGFVVKALS